MIVDLTWGWITSPLFVCLLLGAAAGYFGCRYQYSYAAKRRRVNRQLKQVLEMVWTELLLNRTYPIRLADFQVRHVWVLPEVWSLITKTLDSDPGIFKTVETVAGKETRTLYTFGVATITPASAPPAPPPPYTNPQYMNTS
jgi:hypothetical protein